MLLKAIQEKIQLCRHKGSLVAPSSPEVSAAFKSLRVDVFTEWMSQRPTIDHFKLVALSDYIIIITILEYITEFTINMAECLAWRTKWSRWYFE